MDGLSGVFYTAVFLVLSTEGLARLLHFEDTGVFLVEFGLVIVAGGAGITEALLRARPRRR